MSSIGSRKFKQLVSLCSDDFENVYLADAGSSQLLILDNEFSVIKRTIGKKGTKNGEFNGLIDICFFDGRLYALDKCKRVQIFSKQGDFIRSNKLYRNNSNEEDDSDNVKNKRASKISPSVEKFLEHPISLKGNFYAFKDFFFFKFWYITRIQQYTCCLRWRKFYLYLRYGWLFKTNYL